MFLATEWAICLFKAFVETLINTSVQKLVSSLYCKICSDISPRKSEKTPIDRDIPSELTTPKTKKRLLKCLKNLVLCFI